MQTNINKDIWYVKSNPDEMKNLVDSFKNQLIQFYNDLQRCFQNITLMIHYYQIFILFLLGEILSEMNEFKKEQNIEQISVFNKKINNVIVKQPSSYIFERVGEKYNHFLIDEFQDTSLRNYKT